MKPRKYRKIPIEVEAMRWEGRCLADAFILAKAFNIPKNQITLSHLNHLRLFISSGNDEVVLLRGDWLIKDEDGIFHVRTNKQFIEDFQEVKL